MKVGAVGIGSDGKKHPISAELLMFGNEYDVVREFNAYFLDYQEQYDTDTSWTDRIISSSGDWSGNVYDFYFRVWREQGWIVPTIKEQLESERTSLSLVFEKASNTAIYSRQKRSVIEYLTGEIEADCKTIADLLGISGSRVGAVLAKMVKE